MKQTISGKAGGLPPMPAMHKVRPLAVLAWAYLAFLLVICLAVPLALLLTRAGAG